MPHKSEHILCYFKATGYQAWWKMSSYWAHTLLCGFTESFMTLPTRTIWWTETSLIPTLYQWPLYGSLTSVNKISFLSGGCYCTARTHREKKHCSNDKHMAPPANSSCVKKYSLSAEAGHMLSWSFLYFLIRGAHRCTGCCHYFSRHCLMAQKNGEDRLAVALTVSKCSPATKIEKSEIHQTGQEPLAGLWSSIEPLHTAR